MGIRTLDFFSVVISKYEYDIWLYLSLVEFEVYITQPKRVSILCFSWLKGFGVFEMRWIVSKSFPIFNQPF